MVLSPRSLYFRLKFVQKPLWTITLCPKFINIIMENNRSHKSGENSILHNVAMKGFPYSSSSLPASVSQWHMHSRAVVFHTLYRGQIDTRLCPLINYILLCCTLTFSLPRESSFTSLRHSYTSAPSDVASATSCAPTRSITACSHHCIPNHDPGSLSNPLHRSNSDCIAMFCTTVFCRRLI